MNGRCGWCEKPLSGRQRKWCCENCRKRACDDAHRASCVDCGASRGRRSGFVRADRANERCCACWTHRENVAHLALVEDVAEMYRRGMSYRDIALALGRGPRSVSPEVTEARRLGLIGYRHVPRRESEAA